MNEWIEHHVPYLHYDFLIVFGLIDQIANQQVQAMLVLNHSRFPWLYKGARNKPFTSSGNNTKRIFPTAERIREVLNGLPQSSEWLSTHLGAVWGSNLLSSSFSKQSCTQLARSLSLLTPTWLGHERAGVWKVRSWRSKAGLWASQAMHSEITAERCSCRGRDTMVSPARH